MESKDTTHLLVLAFFGKRYAGKDTAADGTQRRTGGVRASFAGPVKYEAATRFSLDVTRLLRDAAYKEQHRDKLIQVGMEGRDKDPNYWVDTFFANHKDDTLVIVSDLRFPNEVKRLIELGATVKTVRVTADLESRYRRGWRHKHSVDEDPTECAMDDFPHDYCLQNSGTLDQLDNAIDDLVGQFGLRRF